MCKAQLQGVSLGQGFCGGSGQVAFVEFLCMHHNTETRNDRQFEQDVERDPEGKITSRRKRRDTRVN
jgi:hypothetical protein